MIPGATRWRLQKKMLGVSFVGEYGLRAGVQGARGLDVAIGLGELCIELQQGRAKLNWGGRRTERVLIVSDQLGLAANVAQALAASTGTGEPKVGDNHTAGLGALHVSAVEVAVHQTGLVRRDQTAAGIDKGGQYIRPRRGCAVDPSPHGLAIEQLHRDEQLAPGRTDVIDLDDVRMAEPSHRASLAKEASARVGRAVLVARWDQAQRNPALELAIMCCVKGAHAGVLHGAVEDVAPDPRTGLSAGRDHVRAGRAHLAQNESNGVRRGRILARHGRCPRWYAGRSRTVRGRRNYPRNAV